MLIKLDMDKFNAFSENNPDCSEIASGEYIIDIYGDDTALTIDLVKKSDGVEILACAELLYDDELDGWYMGDRMDDQALISKLLSDEISKNV